MNYIVAGMVHAGVNPSHVVNFLSACYISPIDPNTIKKKRNLCILKKMGFRIMYCSALVTCTECEANQHDQGREYSFDAVWQTRGSGWQYTCTV
mgnify:CR=1 FL=1